jgi:hypothetical protein
MTEAERLIYLEHAVDTARWARTRLEQLADEVMHGAIQGGGRELKRKVWGAFADFEEAVRNADDDEMGALLAKVLVHLDGLISMAGEGYVGSRTQYHGRRYLCLAEAMASLETGLPSSCPFDLSKLSVYVQLFPGMLQTKANGRDFQQIAERAYFRAVTEHFRLAIERRIAEQFAKMTLQSVFQQIRQLLSETNFGEARQVDQVLRSCEADVKKETVSKLVIAVAELHKQMAHWSVNCGTKHNNIRQEMREFVEIAEFLSLGVSGVIDIFGTGSEPELA